MLINVNCYCVLKNYFDIILLDSRFKLQVARFKLKDFVVIVHQ